MNVVGHQAESIHGHFVLLTIFGQTFQVDLVVTATEKSFLFLIAAGDDVVEQAGSEDARTTSHGGRLPQVEENCQSINA